MWALILMSDAKSRAQHSVLLGLWNSFLQLTSNVEQSNPWQSVGFAG